MSRLLLDDTNVEGQYLRLKKAGDSCRVMPIFDMEDEGEGVYYRGLHWPEKGQPPAPPIACPKPDHCPLCEQGRKVDFRMSMTVYDIDTKTRRILDGFPAMWMKDLKDVLEDWDWKKVVLKIKRTGEGSMTRRTIVPLPAVEEDVIAAAMTQPFSIEELVAKTGPMVKPAHSDDPGPTHDPDDPLADDEAPF